MTERGTPAATLHLAAGLDRALAWEGGRSVRYLVADLSARGDARTAGDAPPLDLALAVDVSGSMAGDKLDAARRTATAVAEALGERDRLTLVAFDSAAELLLDARAMDEAGRREAAAAIARLEPRGGTDLFGGWLLAAERVATAMAAAPRASHRVVLLSDGQANEGVTDRAELSRHAGALLARGILTSTVGIGDGYDEELLGVMAEAGGGRLHDAGAADDVGYLVLDELREGRHALVERTTLRLSVPASVTAEVVGSWSHAALGGSVEVMVGALLPERDRRVVFRLHLPAGEPGTSLLFGLSASGAAPDGGALLEAGPVEVELRLARGAENRAQPLDADRALAAVRAWQAEVLRRAVRMNRDGDRRAARHYLEREIRWMERYARTLPAAEPLLAELVLVLRRSEERWNERTRKEVYAASFRRSRYEAEPAAAPRASISDRFAR
ncbi:VWA domain-containing protein [Roseomonas sp. SSH11]|uniref:VWA domain-containing protein n=1 Tax=Pararoseomonas baculiformis TaxID=2820812 RepID=A0ABS4AK93_9PROT|nr:VWA domain-containing protein [Pararoseomonas baculiformis]MBP0447441.1 VWA domain-containing protein [Pararoseomonas baculiformis]